MFAIPITEATLDLVTALNGGVRPELEDLATMFVYKGEDVPAEIITMLEFIGWYHLGSDLYRVHSTTIWLPGQ